MKYETVPASANDSTRYSSMMYGADPHCMLTNCSVLAEYQTSAPAADSMALYVVAYDQLAQVKCQS